MYLSKLNSIFSLLGGLFGSFLCHLWAVHSEGRSVRQGRENSSFLL